MRAASARSASAAATATPTWARASAPRHTWAARTPPVRACAAGGLALLPGLCLPASLSLLACFPAFAGLLPCLCLLPWRGATRFAQSSLYLLAALPAPLKGSHPLAKAVIRCSHLHAAQWRCWWPHAQPAAVLHKVIWVSDRLWQHWHLCMSCCVPVSWHRKTSR